MNELIKEEYDASVFQKEIDIDLRITFYDINRTLVKSIQSFKPFGRGNTKPLFLTQHVMLHARPTMLRNGGLKFTFTDGAILFDAIWFKPNGFILESDVQYDIVYALTFDTWLGFEKVMLDVREVQESGKSVIVGNEQAEW